MKTDVGSEAYDYEKFYGLLEDDLVNDHSYQLWLDTKMEEDKERRAAGHEQRQNDRS